MEIDALRQIEELAAKKLKIFEQSKLRYIMRSMIASMFIGFGVIVAFKTANYFYVIDSPFTYPSAALTFCIAIILIYYGGGDLFTGDTFYYSYRTLRKKMSWAQSIKLLCYSYFGNMIGAIAFASLTWGTGLFASEQIHAFLLEIAHKKASLPTSEIFFRGIFCNWLVCLAFFAPYKMKTDGAKMFIMIFLVFSFFIAGFEHSIANMSVFAISIAAKGWDSFTAGQILHNLIPATIGNIIGGIVFMGMFYFYINKPFIKESEE